MAKKRVDISDLVVDTDSFVANVTGISIPSISALTNPHLKIETRPDNSFDIVPVDNSPRIKAAKGKKRTIVKTLGRPKTTERVNFNTMIDPRFIKELKQAAFEGGVTVAAILHGILEKHFN